MSHQLPADCLNEIFEYLEDKDLHSCLLVNRLWCEVSVRRLWTNIKHYKTLVSCLPKESKETLYDNEIIISTQTSKPPLFNYAAFVKSLSIAEIVKSIPTYFISQGLGENIAVVASEVLKMFMSQTSLK